MRLAPIEKPPTWKARIAGWMMKRRLGRVITPAQVIYHRVPAALDISWAILKLEAKGLTLDHSLRILVKTWAAMINHCTFCVDIARAQAVMERIGLDKFDALPHWRTSPLFDGRERAALAYVDATTRDKRVDDATFAELQKHFSDREIVEITVLNAAENFYNLLNIPLEIEEDGLCAIQQQRASGAQSEPKASDVHQARARQVSKL
jgi:alkylhydroperoxidase family enzyme